MTALRGHAYFVELVGRRGGPPEWLIAAFALLGGAVMTALAVRP